MRNPFFSSRVLLFLIASFLSVLGDTVLLFVLPSGFGLEMGGVPSAVVLWLIPSFSIFLSSYLGTSVAGRASKARLDYAKLLFFLSFLEVLVFVLVWHWRGKWFTLFAVTLFVFFYSFAKEGIPRLFYLVSIYRYFVSTENYARIAGLNAGFNVLSIFLATLLSSWLVSKGDWRWSFLLDAITFILFGLTLLFFGRDTKDRVTESNQTNPDLNEGIKKSLKSIIIVVPFLCGTSALVWNYLPLLAEKLNVTSTAHALFLMSYLRVPGMLAAFWFEKIQEWLGTELIVWFIPLLYCLLSVFFIITPNQITFVLFILSQGVVVGLYWPADFFVRNHLSPLLLVRFNTQVLRKMGLFQGLGCMMALFLYQPAVNWIYFVPLCILVMGIMAFLLAKNHRIVVMLLFCFLGLSACSLKKQEDTFYVELPSLSRNMDLNSQLTYAATSILNETSAHLFVIDRDLRIKGDRIKKFNILDGGKKYIFDLEPFYQSARGEEITVEDIVFSIKYYLSQKKELFSTLQFIEGASSCYSSHCDLKGLKIESPSRFSVTLSESHLKFINVFSSSMFVLFKSNRPPLEEIGNCKIPYQTGKSLVTGCDALGIHMLLQDGRKALVNEVGRSPPGKKIAKLLVDNPTDNVSPSLTVLSAFAVPTSTLLSQKQRVALLSSIRENAKTLAIQLKLKQSYLFIPKWLGTELPDQLKVLSDFDKKQLVCPQRAIRIVLDNSLPSLTTIKKFLAFVIHCPLEYLHSEADTFFKTLPKADLAIVWFSPDYLESCDIFEPFNCSKEGSCYFNWNDQKLQKLINEMEVFSKKGIQDSELVLALENRLYQEGYVAPIVEMNWWIMNAKKEVLPIHSAGLCKIKISDFL